MEAVLTTLACSLRFELPAIKVMFISSAMSAAYRCTLWTLVLELGHMMLTTVLVRNLQNKR